MRNYFLIIFIAFSNFIFSQNNISNDKYSGILGVTSNPAYLVNTPYKQDINISYNNSAFGNNVSDFKYLDLLKDSNIKFSDINTLFNTDTNSTEIDSLFLNNEFKDLNFYLKNEEPNSHSYGYLESRTLGPSYMYSINERNTVAIFSTIRANAFFNDINTNVLFKRDNINTIDDLTEFHGKNFHGTAQFISWGELGLSYSTILSHKYDKLLKFGVSLKFLKGLKVHSLEFNEFTSKLNLLTPNPVKSTISVDGSVHVKNSSIGTNYGQGLDIGLVFEKNKRNYHSFHRGRKNNIHFNSVPYKYRLSLSITDIGFLNFDSVINGDNDINVIYPNEDISYSQILSLDNEDFQREKFTYILPTTLHVNYDYNLGKNFFFNTNLDLFLLSYDNLKHIKSISNFSLSARYEKMKFSFSNGFSIDAFSNVKYVMHLRSKLFYVGSSFLLYNPNFNFYNHEFSIGCRIPIYY